MKIVGLCGGVEVELLLVVDVMFLLVRFVEGLCVFVDEFFMVVFNLIIEVFGGVMKLVVDGGCVFGISGFV